MKDGAISNIDVAANGVFLRIRENSPLNVDFTEHFGRKRMSVLLVRCMPYGHAILIYLAPFKLLKQTWILNHDDIEREGTRHACDQRLQILPERIIPLFDSLMTAE